MFSGFGRRMSSLIFGGGPGQTTGAPLQAVIAGNHDEDERPFYVLSGTQLQKWVVSDTSMEKFLYQIDADRLFRDALAKKVWDKDAIHLTQLTTWLLDLQLTRDGVMVLGAGMNMESDLLLHYAVAVIATDASGTPSKLESLTILNYVARYEEEKEEETLSYRLLVSDNYIDEMYLYNDYMVIMETGRGEKAEEVPPPGGRILGAGLSDGTAVFFSISQGLITINSTNRPQTSILGDTTQEITSQTDGSTMQMNASQINELSRSEDKSARLKAAFLASCSGNLRQAQEIVSELFPEDSSVGEIDRLVASLSQDLIDDYPTSDPRWADNARPGDCGSTSSLIILQQLKDKQRAHEYIIGFLKKLQLWDKLRTVKVDDRLMSTRLLLCQHAEQMEAAVILREMHTEYKVVIDRAISKVLSFRGETPSSGLSPNDIFYREVSHIHEIFEALLEYEADIISGNLQPTDIVNVISSVNPVLEGMLHAALQHRQTHAATYQSGAELQPQPEYIPWTSTSGPSGIRTLLTKQYFLTLETALPETRDDETRAQLFQQLLGLADNILDGYTSQLSSLADNPDMEEYRAQMEEKYTQDRSRLISPFLEYDQFERAGSLAEKYADFELLIQICEATGNQERIQRYQHQYSDKNFSDFLFSWYMREGKRGRLLSMPTVQQNKLQSFLQRDDLGYLKWLNDIECQQFNEAHRTLLELGRNEEQYLGKKKTLLSLSKLAALAYEDEDEEMQANIRDIDQEQQLILNQELLPVDLLESMGFDAENMKVLTPVEIIQLYICDENTTSTEYDFKKALDLLQFLDKNDQNIDYNMIQARIWSQAVVRDKAVWLHCPTGDPLDSVKDTIFFKTISLAVAQGAMPSEILPPMDQLLSEELLGELAADRQLRFMLGMVYELAKSDSQ